MLEFGASIIGKCQNVNKPECECFEITFLIRLRMLCMVALKDSYVHVSVNITSTLRAVSQVFVSSPSLCLKRVIAQAHKCNKF